MTESGPRFTVRLPPGREPERAYVTALVLGDWLGLKYEVEVRPGTEVEIRASGEPDGLVLRIADSLLASEESAWLTHRALPTLPLITLRVPEAGTWQGDLPAGFPGFPGPARVPQLYGHGRPDDLALRRVEDGLSLAIDVMGSIFFMVTRYEEVVRSERDAYDRSPAAIAVMVAEGLIERPIVDEYLDLLRASLRTLWPSIHTTASTFRLQLTCDVDEPWATWRRSPRSIMRSTVGDLVKRRRPSLAVQRVRAAVRRGDRRLERDPYEVFDSVMTVSEEHGLRHAFYFLAGNRPGDFDFRYEVEDPPIIDLIRRVTRRGHEVGLHSSHLSYRDPARLLIELDALKRVAAQVGVEQERWGVRQHYLRFAVPSTWRDQEGVGLDFDSTLGYAEMPGFRSGTGRDYPVFDLEKRQPLRMTERPLLVMDVTLFQYLGLSHADAFDTAATIIDRCRLHGSPATLLFHNNAFPQFGLETWYRDLVGMAVGGGRG